MNDRSVLPGGSQELPGILFGVGVPGVDNMERMGVGQSLHFEGSDLVIIGDYRSVEEADSDACGNQGFDGYETADRDFSEEVADFITSCVQPFFEDPTGTGTLLADDDGFLQQLLDGDLLPG